MLYATATVRVYQNIIKKYTLARLLVIIAGLLISDMEVT